ncbi:Nodulation protein S [Streptomyces sp. NPDC056909]|uniref:Nodulation protein S n=1 Tax=Streptomyces sp. NPDC056909 TaxID=3345963 RepID=UPI0036A656B6
MHTVVAHNIPDVIAEFLSVLDLADEDVRILLTGRSCEVVGLPRASAAVRLKNLLSNHPGRTEDSGSGSDFGSGSGSGSAALLREAAAGVPAAHDIWWAHNPGDWRQEQAASGLAAARAADGRTVRHALGSAGHSQFVVDEAHPLSAELLGAKLAALNEIGHELMGNDAGSGQITTGTVPSVEQFLTLTPARAEHLYYLLYSPLTGFAVPVDPWEFETSAYERERISATCAWVADRLPPRSVPGGAALVEAGACEGALTVPLREAGFRVTATEPQPDFRARLARRAGDHAAVTAESIEELAASRARPADGYVLAEVMYYLDDLSVVDRLPTDLLFVTGPPELVDDVLRPYFTEAGRATWHIASESTLTLPRLDFLAAGRAYHRKRGSVGLVCRRR